MTNTNTFYIMSDAGPVAVEAIRDAKGVHLINIADFGLYFANVKSLKDLANRERRHARKSGELSLNFRQN